MHKYDINVDPSNQVKPIGMNMRDVESFRRALAALDIVISDCCHVRAGNSTQGLAAEIGIDNGLDGE